MHMFNHGKNITEKKKNNVHFFFFSGGSDPVTNKRPRRLLITKLKKFGDSFSSARRTQWTVEQLRQVNGCNPTKVSDAQ